MKFSEMTFGDLTFSEITFSKMTFSVLIFDEGAFGDLTFSEPTFGKPTGHHGVYAFTFLPDLHTLCHSIVHTDKLEVYKSKLYTILSIVIIQVIYNNQYCIGTSAVAVPYGDVLNWETVA